VEFPGLPSLKANCNVIKNHLFMILAENSKYGGNDAEHRIMIELSFKLISLMIGSISRVTVTNDQIVVLLTHIDEDITLGGTKPTSFILLNALLERNILNKEVHNIMRAVFKLTIQSENETVRDRCVKACSLYLKQYEKSGKAVVNHLLFFVRHLEYETEPGRMSAIRVILSAIKTFDGSLLETNFNLLLIPLGCRLINEDSFLCKESIYQALKHLILSVNQEKRDKMFQQLILPWFEDQDFKKNILAIHVMSIMIEGETDFLEKRGLNILPLLLKNLRDSAEQEAIQEEKDRLYFQQLTLLRQLLMTDEVLVIRRNNKEPAPQELLEKKDPTRVKKTKSNAAVSPLDILRQEVDQTWNVLQDFYLMYPHSWVRLITAQIFGHLFSLYDPQDLATGVSLSEVRAAASSSLGDEYLIRETRGETKFLLTLTKKFVSLFRGISDLQDPLAEQLVQNLGFVAKLVIFRDRLRREQNTQEKLSNNDCNKDRQETKKVKIERVPREEENDFEEEKVENETEEPFSLKQFVYEIMRAIKLELSLSRSSICIRSHIFKLIAILVVELEKHELVSVLDQLLNPLVREVTDPRNALKTTTASTIQTPDPNNKSSNSFEGNEGRENLLLLSQQVLDIIKPLVGDEVFKHSYTQTQLDIKKRRLQRKQEKAIDVSV
jgi:U3 small nucleolar RNA-associated protein 20